MKHQVVAERYAQALFEIALELKTEEAFAQVLQDILQVMEDHADLKRLLLHPVVKQEDKINLLKQIFAGKIPQQVLHFLFVLVNKKREYALSEIAEEFQRLLNARNETVFAEVTSAVPLYKKTQNILQKELAAYLGVKQVEIDCKEDPSLLGGVTIKIGDQMIDGSLRTQISEMTQTLV